MSISFDENLIEKRRWLILDFLAEAPARSLNDDILTLCFEKMGFPIKRAELKHDLELLEKSGCVTLDIYVWKTARRLKIVTMTPDGERVWKCEQHVSGVAEKRPL